MDSPIGYCINIRKFDCEQLTPVTNKILTVPLTNSSSFLPIIDYLAEVSKWYAQLMTKMEPYLYGNGGPIIMVQVENEYGSYDCDAGYKNWIRDETEKYVNGQALLFTADGPIQVACGKTDNVFATLNFGDGELMHTFLNHSYHSRAHPYHASF